MLIECVLLIVGLALVVLGADFLVDGASSIAKRFGVSDFVIGLTIVGMGTSAPEMVVSFIGALQGNGDIAIGNVVGSNIFNVFLILGATALILPMNITPMNRKKDIPLNIAITLIFIALGMSRTLSASEMTCWAEWMERFFSCCLLRTFICASVSTRQIRQKPMKMKRL